METPLEYGERRARELGLTKEERVIQARIIGEMTLPDRSSTHDQKLRALRDADDERERQNLARRQGQDRAEARRRRWGIGEKRSQRIREQSSPDRQAAIDRMVVEQLPRLRYLASVRPRQTGGHSSLVADVTLRGCGIDPLEVEQMLAPRSSSQLGWILLK